MSEVITPEKVLAFLAKRQEQPETVCLIDGHHANRVAWLNEFAKVLDGTDCDKYSINRRALEARIRWDHKSPEHVVSLFESHEAACRHAFGSVCNISAPKEQPHD